MLPGSQNITYLAQQSVVPYGYQVLCLHLQV